MEKYVLGIETSCDDTAVALVARNSEVVASRIISQNEIHDSFGGIYPEFASRAHIANIIPTIKSVLLESGVGLAQIEAIGVTRGPGLVGSLLVGINTAAILGKVWNKRVYGINHLRGHLRSAELEGQTIAYPAVVLLVSGGHTLLAYMQNKDNIKLLGSTKDDSVGETFDKVGRMLGLPFPAGPLVDKLARVGEATLRFPKPLIDGSYDFSFSGLKSALFRFIEADNETTNKADVSASFIDAIMSVLVYKCNKAIKEYSPLSLVVVGGVAANSQLRNGAKKLCEKHKIELHLPKLKWATDNAAMIALTTWDYIDAEIETPLIPKMGLGLDEY